MAEIQFDPKSLTCAMDLQNNLGKANNNCMESQTLVNFRVNMAMGAAPC